MTIDERLLYRAQKVLKVFTYNCVHTSHLVCGETQEVLARFNLSS